RSPLPDASTARTGGKSARYCQAPNSRGIGINAIIPPPPGFSCVFRPDSQHCYSGVCCPTDGGGPGGSGPGGGAGGGNSAGSGGSASSSGGSATDAGSSDHDPV